MLQEDCKTFFSLSSLFVGSPGGFVQLLRGCWPPARCAPAPRAHWPESSTSARSPSNRYTWRYNSVISLNKLKLPERDKIYIDLRIINSVIPPGEERRGIKTRLSCHIKKVQEELTCPLERNLQKAHKIPLPQRSY